MTTNSSNDLETLIISNRKKFNEKQQILNNNSDLIEFEKTKFFQILKSLFAIFDPECHGSIDINELDVLGANNNEILNDVLNHIRSNRIKLKTITNLNKFLVTFDEFVQSAEIVLEKRKLNRIKNLNNSIPQSASMNSIYKLQQQNKSSSSSSCSSSSSNLPSPTTQTLSQAFETSSNPFFSQTQLASRSKENSVILNNANSCDLNSLIEKENLLLKQGLESIDQIKQWYSNQLNENKIKQTNISKLKYQNLFTIDRMLIDLKQLNDLNGFLNEFLNNKNCSSVQNQNNLPLGPPPSYKDYVEQFGLNSSSKHEIELDKYLKEKQEKIENLQKEKSFLIRKLFEIKSESESLSKNILKLSKANTNEREIPIIIEKGNASSTSLNMTQKFN